MKRPSRRLLLPLVLVLGGSAGAAFASRSGDDRARAEALISELEQSPAHARLAHDAIESAKHAARRADEARAAGDHVHAPELDALAREWAETGTDLVRAADAEKKLANMQRELTRVETQTTRARALLEETVARRGRARAKLEELEKPGGTKPEAVTPAPKATGAKATGSKSPSQPTSEKRPGAKAGGKP